jgi:hypothetical protein
MKESEFEFDQLADHLAAIGTLTSPAELHGLLCGRLCGGARYGDDDWLRSSVEFLNPAHTMESEQETVLVELYHHALAQLQDHQLGFMPILPADDASMSLRLAALGQWCHGFLNGFGTSGITKEAELSAETAEALRDFAAFVQLDQDSDDDEDGERDFLEVVEYVRVAALSVFMEMTLAECDADATTRIQLQESVETPTLH